MTNRPVNKTGIGIYNGFSALIASKMEFDFLWLSSFCLSASKSRPDLGLLSFSELYDVVKDITICCPDAKLVVDMDSGYGDEVYLFAKSKELMKLGVSGICIEDNPLSKVCSLYDYNKRELATTEQHKARIRALAEAKKETGSVCEIIARTEALVAKMTQQEALHRASEYISAGANAIFVQSTESSGAEIISFCRSWNRRCPVYITPTKYPTVSNQVLFENGATNIIFANQLFRHGYYAMIKLLERIKTAESLSQIDGQMLTIKEISDLLEIEKYLI